MHNILLGVTGSVAAIKINKIVDSLEKIGKVKIVSTKAGRFFIDKDRNFENDYILDQDEWSSNYELGDDILHINLRKWASCFIIAPLSANTLSKIASGQCDNLLTSVARAWDWNKPFIVCPSMNTMMLSHPITNANIETIQNWGVKIVPSVVKKLACGDYGDGAMASSDDMAKIVYDSLKWHFPLINYNGIPINHHPGAFGFKRKKNYHPGVDLYTNDGEPVYAVENGVIVNIEQFTGPELGHTWWEKTWGVMIEGPSGVVNYGEITPSICLKNGDTVKQGQLIGNVKRVLFKDRFRSDIPGHSTSMLHLELYEAGSREFAHWHSLKKEPNLLDPTQYLLNSFGDFKKTLTWENLEGKDVG